MSIINAAQKHQFHPATLSQSRAIRAFDSIVAKAELLGLKPVINNAQQLSQLATDYVYTENGIELQIKVPLCSSNDAFELHEFNALPMALGTNAFVQLESDFPLLGVGEPDLNGKQRFIEMQHTELAQCDKIGQVYLCSKKQIVKRPGATSCLNALYNLDHKQAKLDCKVDIREKHDHAVATGADSFVYFSNTPSTFRYVCRNNSISRPQRLEGITRLEAPQNCIIETSHFFLHPQNDLDIPMTTIQYHWSLSSFELLKNDTSLDTVDKAIVAYKGIPGAPELTPRVIGEFEERNKAFYKRYVPFTAIVVSVVALTTILVIMAAVVYKNFKANQTIANATNPRYRFNELIKTNETIDALEQLIQERRRSSQ